MAIVIVVVDKFTQSLRNGDKYKHTINKQDSDGKIIMAV